MSKVSSKRHMVSYILMLVNVVQNSCIAFCIPNNALLIKKEKLRKKEMKF